VQFEHWTGTTFVFRAVDVLWCTLGVGEFKAVPLCCVTALSRKIACRWASNTLTGGALIAAIAILLPTLLSAQQSSLEAVPTVPGVTWEGPPIQGDWEPTGQGEVQGQTDSRQQGDEAAKFRQEQALLAQQSIVEQARRMADLMFWQLIIGAAVLVGLGITIYYTRRIAHAASAQHSLTNPVVGKRADVTNKAK
jgi:hypothetical protein